MDILDYKFDEEIEVKDSRMINEFIGNPILMQHKYYPIIEECVEEVYQQLMKYIYNYIVNHEPSIRKNYISREVLAREAMYPSFDAQYMQYRLDLALNDSFNESKWNDDNNKVRRYTELLKRLNMPYFYDVYAGNMWYAVDMYRYANKLIAYISTKLYVYAIAEVANVYSPICEERTIEPIKSINVNSNNLMARVTGNMVQQQQVHSTWHNVKK